VLLHYQEKGIQYNFGLLRAAPKWQAKDIVTIIKRTAQLSEDSPL